MEEEPGMDEMLVGDGSLDYKGRPANKQETGGWKTTHPSILQWS